MFRVLLATVVLFSGYLTSVQGASGSETVSDSPYDHLACYKVDEPKRFRARVRLDSAFADLDIPSKCKVKGRSRVFCAPVRKSVESLKYRDDAGMEPQDMPGQDRREGRLCYRLKCSVEDLEGPLLVQDQFGRHALRDFELKRLCTNARIISDEGNCDTDGDCPDGEVCEPGAPFDLRPTVCVPGCHRDDQCALGQECLEVTCITTPCPRQCVGDVGDCGDCFSDSDCPAEQHCNVDDVCLLACDCPLCAVCAGECVTQPVGQLLR